MSIVEPVKYKKCVKVPLSDEEIELLKIHTTNERDLEKSIRTILLGL